VSGRRNHLVAAIVVFALATPTCALASAGGVLSGSTSDSVTLDGATSVAISGHYAYTTAYYAGKLAAIDISNPANPTLAGTSAAANSLIDGTTVNIGGGYAYVVSKNRNASMASNDDGTGNSLTILDIHTNPAVPAIVGSLRDTNEFFGGYGVAVSGRYAYVAGQGVLSGQPAIPDTGTGSFAVVNVSNPAAPRIVSHLDNSSLPMPWNGSQALEHATAVFVHGHYAYVTAAYSNRLTIIDISNPSNPRIIGSNPNLAFPVDVAVAGHYAYVADQTQITSYANLAVVNVANPARPKVVGFLKSSALSGAYRIRLHGHLAYVSAVYAATVAAVDISNPTNPVLAAWLTDTVHLNRTTGLDVDPTGRYVVASSPYLATQGQPLYPPFPPAPGSTPLTGTISAITLAAIPGRVSAGRAKALSGGGAKVKLRCTGVTGATCTASVSITVTETLAGNKLLAVTATKRHKAVVVLGTKTIKLKAGQSRTVAIALNRIGRRLLAARAKLRVSLKIAALGVGGRRRVVSSQHLSFVAGPKKR
jgi:hypothetical protein